MAGDALTGLEWALKAERSRVKELKAQLASMAERMLELIEERERLEAQVAELVKGSK